MGLTSTILGGSLLAALVCANPIQRRETGTAMEAPFAVDTFWDGCDAGRNEYVELRGDGSSKAGWPRYDEWVSFSDLWCINKQIMLRSCSANYQLADNTEEEMEALHDGIAQVAMETKTDHRFILAVIMQESQGCVRMPSTASKTEIDNIGLMQDYKGQYSCNHNGQVSNPCPRDTIIGMIREGVSGSHEGHGLAEDVMYSKNWPNVEMAQGYYRGASMYDGGNSVTYELEKSNGHGCYASDVANRLVGWATAERKCSLG